MIKKTMFERKIKKLIKSKNFWISILVISLVFIGSFLIWISSFNLPNLGNFEERQVVQSTKIYDRTGEIVLFDVFKDIKRTVVQLENISPNLINATIAVEDKDFYKHNGIQISSILRAVAKNLSDGNLLGGQGGSTITQQVIKNALLTREKKISRKIKEWVLAPRLESVLSKDEILEVYLNEIPYGGSVYGIQEASLRFFGKNATDLSVAESAYLAALPQAPTYFSPYGNNIEELEKRKNFVLDQMVEIKYITKEEAEQAKQEEVSFQKQEDYGIKAPHFVMYIIEQLEKEYGRDVVENGGLKVITTLDYELQEKAEEVAKKYALENSMKFDAENAAIVAVSKEGEILTMVGSRDYFDEEIDGNFNITTASRQPGSSIKPIIYSEAFNKGFRPETVVFDLDTEFSATCSSGGNCYRPVNYDGIFRGPMSLREALAQSVNIPAVKTFYLAGLEDSLQLAKNMGLETLGNIKQYGLTLVLGGGEVTPLDMATAYSVFAAEGIKYDRKSILKIESSSGEVLLENKVEERFKTRVLPEQTARLISDVLSDNSARTPAFGSNSFLNINNVAVKTGTTNDYRDAWIVGYSSDISVAAWAGNNDNRSMEKKVAGFIVAPMWNEFMNFALEKTNNSGFTPPSPIDPNIKPIIAGHWQGGSFEKIIDKNTGKTPTEETKPEDIERIVTSTPNEVHNILHWINKSDPLGPYPSNPYSDPQYPLWEASVQNWLGNQNFNFNNNSNSSNNSNNEISITSPVDGNFYNRDSIIYVTVSFSKQIKESTVSLDDQTLGSLNKNDKSASFSPSELNIDNGFYNLKVEIIDQENKKHSKTINIEIR